MPKSKAPIVIYGVYRGTEVELAFGYLLQGGGLFYCQPSEETVEKHAVDFAAFEIDPRLLQEEPDSGADRRLYLYLAVRGAPTERGTLSSIQGRFQEG